MKIVIAIDKFKHSLTSFKACDAVEQGLKIALPHAEIAKLPMSDGGDGIADVMAYYLAAEKQVVEVWDPLFRPINAYYYIAQDGKTAFIEMAKASGLNLLQPHEFNCALTSTYGTGQLIKDAVQKGVSKIILGIGGSATNDGGIGLAAALGYRFIGKEGKELKPIGSNLIHISSIDKGQVDLKGVEVEVACDVTNYLTGKNGATYIYGPQKGADEKMLVALEEGMMHYTEVVEEFLGVDVSKLKGGGAAGGTGAGCIAFLNAKLVSGVEKMFVYSNAEKEISGADVVITGEGKIDEQTLQGKLIAGITGLANRYNKPVIGVCGALELPPSQQKDLGLQAAFSILNKPMNLQQAYEDAFTLLVQTAFNIGRLL